jgi:hypothetical protein
MERIREVSRVTDYCGAPPVRDRCRRVVSFVLISVCGEYVIVLVGVKLHIQANLFKIVQAGSPVRLILGRCQRRQQQRRQNGDDRNNDQQFD